MIISALGCSRNYNLLFVLDRSTSISANEMEKMIDFIISITR